MANGNDRGSTLKIVLIVLKAAVRMRATILRNKLGEARVDSDLYFPLALAADKAALCVQVARCLGRPPGKVSVWYLIPRW